MSRIKKRIKTYAFIDASNIIYGTQDEGWKVDFRKLYKYLAERYNCRKIYYFGDFAILLEYFLKMGKEIIVIGNSKRTAREIKQLKGVQFNDLGVLRLALARK